MLTRETDVTTLRGHVAAMLKEEIFDRQANLREMEDATVTKSVSELREEALRLLRNGNVRSLAVSTSVRGGAEVDEPDSIHKLAPLQHAVQRQRQASVLRMLAEAGADTNKKWVKEPSLANGWVLRPPLEQSPLYIATKRGDHAAVKVLIEMGTEA